MAIETKGGFSPYGLVAAALLFVCIAGADIILFITASV